MLKSLIGFFSLNKAFIVIVIVYCYYYYIDHLASPAEEAASQGNFKDLYLTTKKLAGKFQQTDMPVEAKDRKPLMTVEEQLKRWVEHFRELLNCPAPELLPDIPPAETELPISCEKPTKAEIKKAIMTLRNGKAAGAGWDTSRGHKGRH